MPIKSAPSSHNTLPVSFMAATASLLPLRLQGPQITPLQPNSAAFPFRMNPNPNPLFPSRSPPARASQSSSPSGPLSAWDREEARWLREEQRWLREEQRWLREESRWNSEREALLREIAALKLRIEALQQGRPPVVLPDAAAGLEALLRALKDRAAEAEGGPRVPPALAEEADVKEMVLEQIRVPEAAVQQQKSKEWENRKSLRKGAEGENVRAMQEALQRLGFYSGEEDMEFAIFSSGTERAVKTWQATLGAAEDGVMTSELLEKLFTELEVGKAVNKSGDQKGDFISMTEKDGPNGTAVSSVTGFTEIQQTVIKDDGVAGVEVSEQRVFLLGENRWEEPSRLVGRDNLIGNKAVSTTKCLSCRGEGRLLCTECDGTGEPNIEPQFLEWVDEGAKCPYCEGLGYTICDVCEGKTTV